jgi:uncharacterized membrane protein
MAFTSGFLIVGLLMVLAGAVLIYMSLKASPKELAEDSEGVVYIGPLPIVVKDGRKWILAALIITAVLIAYLATKTYYPDLLGGAV